MVYLSLGNISSSRGISPYHRSRARVVCPFRCKAASRVSTTRSTERKRLRCRAFWGAEMRHGVFLCPGHVQLVVCFSHHLSSQGTIAGQESTYQRRPEKRGDEGLNIFAARRGNWQRGRRGSGGGDARYDSLKTRRKKAASVPRAKSQSRSVVLSRRRSGDCLEEFCRDELFSSLLLFLSLCSP